MSRTVRVRFAPSPTGSLHIGGARTALFNWLFARRVKGTFILRIEDTDALRSTEESAASIIRDLSALGLDWDEGPGVGGAFGPYFQSDRLEHYRRVAEEFLDRGLAYRSFSSAAERDLVREARERGESSLPATRYAQHSPEEEKARLQKGEEFAIVFRVPPGETTVHDLIRGDVVFQNQELGDFVLIKSDGRASYNFAAALDDFDMKISHVLRGEDHLSNTPKQILLHQALGRALPAFGHVPLILGPDKSRLSKRHGATSVQNFLALGILPEALVNHLALLGWSSPDGQEFFTLHDLIERFTLERVGKTSASFDPGKLEWMNGQHLTAKSPQERGRLVAAFLRDKGIQEEGAEISPERGEELATLVGDRMKVISQFLDYADFLFVSEVSPGEDEVQEALSKSRGREALNLLADRFERLPSFTAESVEGCFREHADSQELKLRELVAPARLALTGKRVGPGLFESAVALGRARSTERLRRFSQGLAGTAGTTGAIPA